MPILSEQVAINKVHVGNAIKVIEEFPDAFIDMIVTSPPYYSARDYGTFPGMFGGDASCEHEWTVVDVLRKPTPGDKPSRRSAIARHRKNSENRPARPSQSCNKCGAWIGDLGNEPSPSMFIDHLCSIFDAARRVLKPRGTVFVNIGDTYSGSCGVPPYDPREGERKPSKKNMMLVPQRFVIAMQERGWIVRNEIIWNKFPGSKPETVHDRFARSHEPFYFFTMTDDYHFETPMESGRATRRVMRTVWNVSPSKFKGGHFATFPPELAAIPIALGCPPGGIVLDPFIGSGSTAIAAASLNRHWIGIDVNPDYANLAAKRTGIGMKKLDSWM